MHREPEAFKLQIIDQLTAYANEIRQRDEMVFKTDTGKRFITDEPSKLWKANKQFRSLYSVARVLEKGVFAKKFKTFAPHLAEYRAMINLIKQIK